jgi:chromate transport protein ChrA
VHIGQRGRISGRLNKEAAHMLTTILVLLLILWLLGVVSSYTLGGFIHLLLIIAIALVLIRIIQGRRPI